MSVPLDNLYHWVEGLLPSPAILYVFRPHGNREIFNCQWLNDYYRYGVWRLPGIICHDQEPLDWDFYNNPSDYVDSWKKRSSFIKPKRFVYESDYKDFLKAFFEYCSNFNLASIVIGSSIVHDQVILLHSEKNSKDLAKYQQSGMICVHYWCHAMIALDWYRFAEIDTRLNVMAQKQNTFLIYCRDWSHSREYRIKFLEMLVENDLDHDSLTSVMHTNSDNTHFSQHKFINPAFELNNAESISSIKDNIHSSTASADYNYQDFVETEISVVLETVFDDSRIHLTEKSLRPIACGHPFVLAAGPGALEYMRSYGFKTFAPWIDESYDLETDSLKRLEKIIHAMKKIQSLQGTELADFKQAIKSIAQFNKQHFFSKDFLHAVQSELQNGLAVAVPLAAKSKGVHWKNLRRIFTKQKISVPQDLRADWTQFVRQLRQCDQGGQSNPLTEPPA